MDSPYRIVEEKEDVVNTRLRTLEKDNEASRTVTMALAAAVVILFVVVGIVAVNLIVRNHNESSTCRSEVKALPSIGASDRGDVACSHPDQRLNLVTSDPHHIMIECFCHGNER